MKNEETAYNEKTQYEDSQVNVQPEENVANKSAEKENLEKENSGKEPLWKKAASGMGMGILLGSISSFTATKAFAGGENEVVEEEETISGEQPAWSDGDVDIASGVNDDMSFSQAFSAARSEVGSGGCFEWRGNVYSTFTAEEWNSMSAEEKAEYNDHFSWGGGSSSEDHDITSENSASNETAANDVASQSADGQATGTQASGNQTSDSNIAENQNDELGSVEVIDVWNEDGINYAHVKVDSDDYVLGDIDGDEQFDVIAGDLDGDGDISEDEIKDISDVDLKVSDLIDEPVRNEQEDADVVILGVRHDAETGVNSAGVMVDDNLVVFVDVDGKDNRFDIMASDYNGDGNISDNEMVDISDDNFRVSDFEESSDLYADNGGDYIGEN